MSNEKFFVSCPYCGSKMLLKTGTFDFLEPNGICVRHWYECTNEECESESPTGRTEEDAYEAAMVRWQEPNRVLTLDEITADANADSWKFEWVERKGEKDIIHQTCPFSVNTERTIFASPGDKRIYRGDNSNYGETWRCWLRKPTPEEMANTPWEAKHNEH